MASIFSKISQALSKTRQVLTTPVGDVLSGTVEVLRSPIGELVASGRPVDRELLGHLEEGLVAADVGPLLAAEIVADIEKRAKRGEVEGTGALRAALVESIAAKLRDPVPPPPRPPLEVIFAVGVNGVGKTTTLAKLARRCAEEGRRPLLAAADTFRAAATEQLEVWAERAGVPVVKHKSGADPAAVLFDAIAAAKSRGLDLVLVDTAGRLHNKKPLMDELSKLRRIASREVPGAPHQVLLILDATTGGNGVAQAREFQAAVGASGVVLTKLDGTAKGGVVLQIHRELGLPVRWVGLGEGLDDLERFDPDRFAEALV
jgi:fused signal recognition particle receptor